MCRLGNDCCRKGQMDLSFCPDELCQPTTFFWKRFIHLFEVRGEVEEGGGERKSSMKETKEELF